MNSKLFKPLDPRIARELKSQRKPIFAGLACVVATSALTVCTIRILEQAVGAVQKGDYHALGYLSLLIVGVFGVKYWFTRGQTYYLSKAAALLTNDLRRRLFDKLQRLPISYFNRTRTGMIQSVLTNDVNLYQNAVMVVRDSIDGPIKAAGAVIMIFVIEWRLAIISLLFVPMIALIIQRNGRKVKAAQAQVQHDYAELQGTTQEALYGMRVVKAFSAEDRIRATYRKLATSSYQSQMQSVRRIASLRPLVELFGASALAILLFICGWLAKTGGLTVPQITAVLYAFEVINQGFRTMGYVNNTYSQVQAASDHIYGEILGQEDEDVDTPESIPMPPVDGRVEFKNVCFTYADGTVALRNVSFTLEPSTSLALVGYSGAGKSTIADLVLRFYEPTSGEILLDGINIRNFNLAELRGQIGVVPQQTFLFAGTVRDNITLGAPNTTEQDVVEASVAANANKFIESLPDSYLSTIGEGGVGLSGGEKQRIAIARAIVRKPKLLVLDEATSSLDAVSEKTVQQALDQAMRGRSTLFIAHRLTSAARADKILMLSKGEVVEIGTHNQLMKNNGPYAAMYRAFSSGLLDENIA